MGSFSDHVKRVNFDSNPGGTKLERRILNSFYESGDI